MGAGICLIKINNSYNMKEYLLLIRSEGDYCSNMKPEEHKAHIKRVSNYIQNLSNQGKFKGAQPLQNDGLIIKGKNGVFKDGPFNETKEIIGGYFLIEADDLNEAKEIAKANPIFNDADNIRIEIREIKHEEGIN